MYPILLLFHIVTTYIFILWPATLFLLSVHTDNHSNFIPIEDMDGFTSVENPTQPSTEFG